MNEESLPNELNWTELTSQMTAPLRMSESELLYDWPFTDIQFGLAPSPLRLTARFSSMNNCGHSPYITSPLTRGWVCHLQLLLVLASIFILGSESHRARNHILLSKIWDFPFCRLLRLAGLRWRDSTPPPHGNPCEWVESSRVESYVTTHGQSASLSWCKAPIWGLRPESY
jgi:hypothetical protein